LSDYNEAAKKYKFLEEKKLIGEIGAEKNLNLNKNKVR
jgi:hypothetical protein